MAKTFDSIIKSPEEYLDNEEKLYKFDDPESSRSVIWENIDAIQYCMKEGFDIICYKFRYRYHVHKSQPVWSYHCDKLLDIFCKDREFCERVFKCDCKSYHLLYSMVRYDNDIFEEFIKYNIQEKLYRRFNMGKYWGTYDIDYINNKFDYERDGFHPIKVLEKYKYNYIEGYSLKISSYILKEIQSNRPNYLFKIKKYVKNLGKLSENLEFGWEYNEEDYDNDYEYENEDWEYNDYDENNIIITKKVDQKYEDSYNTFTVDVILNNIDLIEFLYEMKQVKNWKYIGFLSDQVDFYGKIKNKKN